MKNTFECSSCGAEYTIRYDRLDNTDEPIYCPFCGEDIDNLEELDFGD